MNMMLKKLFGHPTTHDSKRLTVVLVTTIFRINSCSLIVDNQRILSEFFKHLKNDKSLDVSNKSIYDSSIWPKFNL